MEKELQKGSATLFGFTMITNVMNYGFQICAAWVLSVGDYSVFLTLMSFIMVMNVPGLSFQMVSAKYIADFRSEEDRGGLPALISQFIAYLAVFMALFLVLGVLVSPFVNSLLSFGGFITTVIAFVIITVSYAQYVTMGTAQGLRRFFALAVIGVAAALVKIFGVGLVWAVPWLRGFSYEAILALMTLAPAASIAVGWVMLLRSTPGIRPRGIRAALRAPRLFSFAFMGTALVVNLCSVLMMNIDVFLIRILFPVQVSDMYNPAAQFGKILFYATTALTSVLYPLASRQAMENKPTFGIYTKSFGYIAACVACFIVPILLFPHTIVTVLLGAKHLDCVPYMIYSCALATSVIFNALNANYLVAINRSRILLMTYLPGVAVSIACGALFSASVPHMILALLTVMVAVFIINFVYIVSLHIRQVKGGAYAKTDQQTS